MSLFAINVAGAVMLVVSLAGGPPTPPQTKPPVDAGTPLTVAGCLRKWDPAMAGKLGIQNPAKLEYLLTDLAPGTAAAPAQPNVLRYLVKAKDTTVALTPHVNHRVEVSGIVTGLSETNPTGTPQVAPTLTVATVKMISTECI